MLLERWVEEAGVLRGRSQEAREAEFLRLQAGNVPAYCVMAYVRKEPVACGLVMHEEELAGLFDIYTAEEHRSHGIGTAITAHLLTTARRMGAQHGWLSVIADNAPATATYAKLGFETVYEYWYRIRPGDY